MYNNENNQASALLKMEITAVILMAAKTAPGSRK